MKTKNKKSAKVFQNYTDKFISRNGAYLLMKVSVWKGKLRTDNMDGTLTQGRIV